ncbi:MAG: hypothetical protein JNM90_00575 [Burkholderiales bacterium]|nr:hypothetical protein [Burkholderiales bacterium]
MSSLVHATARLCAATPAAALAHLSTQAGMARWVLGLWNCREVEPGLFEGASLFDGATGFVRVVADAARGQVDYLVGATRTTLVPRIQAGVIAGETLGHPAGTCVVTLTAWRTGDMSDERWARLMHTHETEIELIRAQLAAAR